MAFYEAKMAGMGGEEPIEPPPQHEGEFIDALQTKGKSKGKA